MLTQKNSIRHAIGAGALMIAAMFGLNAAFAQTSQDAARTHEEQMQKGKSHEEARQATPTTPIDPSIPAAHDKAMREGKSHDEAVRASSPNRSDGKSTEEARRHAKAMQLGRSHEEAREIASQPDSARK